MNMSELKERGWMLVDGIASQSDLLELGKSIGTPVPTPNGELVKEIRRSSASAARPGSQSALYGVGSFPLHTDTVFWATPVRYVLLRGYGDTRRPTTVMSFADMLSECDSKFHSLLEKSVWRISAGNKMFYCSLCFRCESSLGWRYDSDLMYPANPAAVEVHPILRRLVHQSNMPGITWTGNTAVIFCNWTTLHGRGPQPLDEGIRVIERLYVR
jgi:alpha-ketoglutarate-dependent taurine dioxygenase